MFVCVVVAQIRMYAFCNALNSGICIYTCKASTKEKEMEDASSFRIQEDRRHDEKPGDDSK